MSKLHPFFPIFFLSLLLSIPSFAQQKGTETTRRGPIFHLIGGLEQDLGSLRPERYNGMLYITNPGEDTLRIADWKNSGGNLIGRVRTGVIPPGDTGTIEIWGDFENIADEREISKSYTITTNDPENYQSVIRLRALIRPDVIATPSNRYFIIDSLKPGEEWETDIILEGGYEPAVTLYKANVDVILPGYRVRVGMPMSSSDSTQLSLRNFLVVNVHIDIEEGWETNFPPHSTIATIEFPTSTSFAVMYHILTGPREE